jgi:hypothetical protein
VHFESYVFWFCLADLVLPLLAWYVGAAFDKSSATLFSAVFLLTLVIGTIFWIVSSEPERVLFVALSSLSAGLSILFFCFGKFNFAPNAFWMQVLRSIWVAGFRLLDSIFPESKRKNQKLK